MTAMRNAATQTQATGKQISSALTSASTLAKTAMGGLAGALTVDFLVGQTQAAFDFADGIVDLSDRVNVSTKTLQEFRYAAQMSGSSVESADAALEKFGKNLGNAIGGNKAMAKAFADLGVTSQDTDTALKQTMDGISKLGTVTERNAKTIQIFGKSAGDLTVLMSGGSKGYNELAEAARSYGIVLDDYVLRNAGQVNDKLDTMKMILNAQMASTIIQNADALVTLANGFITAAGAATQFFSAMRNDALVDISQGRASGTPVARMLYSNMTADERERAAKADLMKTRTGRNALFDEKTQQYNDGLRRGESKDSIMMQAILAEREDIAKAEVSARRSERALAPPTSNLTIPKPTSTAKAKHSPTLKTDAELEEAWNRDFLSARSNLYGAQAELSTDISEQADLKAQQLRNRFFMNTGGIEADTGSDREVREGKKRYTDAQSKQLIAIEQEIFDLEYDRTLRDRDQAIAEQKLSINQSSLTNQLDILSSEDALARSSGERRSIALRIIELQSQQERIALDAVIASKTATDAEKAIAQARLAILDTLKGQAIERAKRDTAGPLAQYLDAIPRSAAELDDQFASFEAEGLGKLEDGLLGVFKGTETVTGALKGMFGTVLDGLAKIAIQQAIIKPLGSLLFGGGDGDGGGGGLLGGIIKSIVPSVTGARANGGMTQPGTYLVGERGPELATFNAPANVTTNAALNLATANARSTGPVININGPITSNDPAMVRVMVAEGVMAAIPSITKQSTDATIKRLNRRGL